jgi:hypothetical protein
MDPLGEFGAMRLGRRLESALGLTPCLDDRGYQSLHRDP